MTLPKPRDRRVIGRLVGRDHAVGDVLDTVTLDQPRGPLPTRIRVQQQRDHHRRIMRRSAVTIATIRPVERLQIKLRDGVDHEQREVIIGQPLAHARRQQQHLITITRDEVLSHPQILLNPSDDTGLCATATANRSSVRQVPAGCSCSSKPEAQRAPTSMLVLPRRRAVRPRATLAPPKT